MLEIVAVERHFVFRVVDIDNLIDYRGVAFVVEIKIRYIVGIFSNNSAVGRVEKSLYEVDGRRDAEFILFVRLAVVV